MASASCVSLLAAVLLAAASELPCPAASAEDQQPSSSSWQLLRLPPHGIIVIVPSYVHWCPPARSPDQFPALQPAMLQAGVPTTLNAAQGHAVPTTREKVADAPLWDVILRSFINSPDRPCGKLQERDNLGMCRDVWHTPNDVQY